jgi:hypothetical protein
MNSLFESDEILWVQSHSPIDEPISTWWFETDVFYFANTKSTLSREDGDRTVFELAMFDIHFTYWKSRREYVEGKLQYNHNFNYHSRLRSAVEHHFKQTENDALTSPPILTPWLWRTFSLRTHTQTGRKSFMELVTRHGLNHSLQRPPNYNGHTCFPQDK